MKINLRYVIAVMLFSLASVAQPIAKTESKVSYLDSIKAGFIKDNLASCVDSLWMKELTSLDLYNGLESEIKNINLDQKVDFELPTELLKARLKEMDARSPFNIEYNQGLENIIKSFLKNRKKSFERLMAISEYYFPIFEEALAKQNVPLEIKYLAVVESALNPKAVSRVGATGLWQFMYQTGKQYSLDIDSYVDDRSDPIKASAAAAQYMTNMYKIFGDWDLVLASYNSGPGNVAKAIRRSGGQQNYWNIRKHLPQETAAYVPAFLATMYIYEYHKEHGIVPNRAIIKQFATDTVMIKKEMSFRQISDLLDIPVSQLQLLNPQYKLNVVPAYLNKKHFLTLPLQKMAVFTSNEDKIYAYAQHEMELREKPFSRQQAEAGNDSLIGDSYVVNKTKHYKVRRGDKLSEIADRYNVSMSEIKRWNKLRSNKVATGKSLKIITSERIVSRDRKVKVDKTDSIPTATAVASNEGPQPEELKTYKEEKVVSFKEKTKTYKVKRGDNLGEISEKFDVSVADIKRWNKLKRNTVAVGKSLKIISTERVVTVVKKEVKSDALASNEKSKKDRRQDAEKPADVVYVVQQGDNLNTIAKKYNVSVEDLKKWNNLHDNNIQLESKLKIADIIDEDVATVSPKGQTTDVEYIIQKGDNLSSIAKKNNVAVSDLKEWNNFANDAVQLGAKIIIGKKLVVETKQAVAEKHPSNKKVSKAKQEDHYYVKKGDSLFSIAQKYPGVTISDIKKWNGISGNNLKPGMKLKING